MKLLVGIFFYISVSVFLFGGATLLAVHLSRGVMP